MDTPTPPDWHEVDKHIAASMPHEQLSAPTSVSTLKHRFRVPLLRLNRTAVIIAAAVVVLGGSSIAALIGTSSHKAKPAAVATNSSPTSKSTNSMPQTSPSSSSKKKASSSSSTKKNNSSSSKSSSHSSSGSSSGGSSSSGGGSSGGGDSTPTPPVDTTWALQYSTAFTSLSGWTVYNNQTQNNDNSINLSKNVYATPSGLVITGKKESGYSRPYTSADMVGKSNQVVGNYFKAEVTGSFQDISGIWPCLLWFRPNNGTDGEIDVMEWMGGLWPDGQKRVAITMHNEYGATHSQVQKPLLLSTNTWYNPALSHTYTIEKVPGKITVWIDGHTAATFSASDKSWWNTIMENSSRTWYPRITLQIGNGATSHVVPDPGASFSSTTMRVTSLKLWNYNK